MGRAAGSRYWVLVNKHGDLYEYEDIFESFVQEFESESDALDEMECLLDAGILKIQDGWHPECHRR